MAVKRVFNLCALPAFQVTSAMVSIPSPAAYAQTVRLPSFRTTTDPDTHAVGLDTTRLKIVSGGAVIATDNCWFPTIRCMGAPADRNNNINKFFGTADNFSYSDQVKSIYNGASSSATVSADLASLNFSNGTQLTVGTNIQAGSSGVANVGSGTTPTLSAASAGQAAQNMLYGGTIVASDLLPVFFYTPTSADPRGATSVLIAPALPKAGVKRAARND